MAEKTPEEMREAVLAIREKMAAAAREAGRDPAEVQLCAACKTRTAETVAASAALPIDVFGENHVQELCANFDAGAYCGKPSHFIGHLQTNKIKKVLGRASLIQSVGSEHLLTAIEKEAAKAGIPFYGRHDSGDEYGPYCFASWNRKMREAPLDHDGNLSIAVDEDLKPIGDPSFLRRYIRVLKRVKAAFAGVQAEIVEKAA